MCVLERLLPSDVVNEGCSRDDITSLGREVLVVGNSHFYFHPEADHIRLLQSVVSLALLQDVAQRWQKQEGCRVSVVFCGDLNSTPDTGVYQLVTQGRVEDTHPGWTGEYSTR